jgi:hypothetical protein
MQHLHQGDVNEATAEVVTEEMDPSTAVPGGG